MKKWKQIVFIAATWCMTSTQVLAQFNGVFFDPRDGQEYPTILIEIDLGEGLSAQREWLAENLNFDSPTAYCYKDYKAYCNFYGRLYSYEEAKTVCPQGWHLSTSSDWQELYKKYGGIHMAGQALRKGGDSGMDLIMGGFGEIGGEYIDIGANSYYWKMSSLQANPVPGIVTVYSDIDEVLDRDIGKSHKNSVRCVKNY